MIDYQYPNPVDRKPKTILWQFALLGLLGHYDAATEETFSDILTYHQNLHIQQHGPCLDEALVLEPLARQTESAVRVQFKKQIKSAADELNIEPQPQRLIEISGSSYSRRDDSLESTVDATGESSRPQ